MNLHIICIAFFVICVLNSCETKKISHAETKKVAILQNESGYSLLKDGKPFYVKGAAGFSNMESLKKAGGNTIRTWSTERADSILDEAQKNDLSVVLGLFMLGEVHGFDYDDEEAVKKQFDDIKKQVLKYKDHPALLIWGVGNEMDIYSADKTVENLKVWDAVNEICKMIHEVDPNHPTTTMIIPFRNTMWNINRRCPDLDILSINTFGEINKLSSKLNEPIWGWDGPYLVSEWGTLGWWEVEKTLWDAPIEATTTKKAEFYEKNYSKIQSDSSKCLGSCVFYWGQKQEKTPSWFSMFTPDGRPTEAVQVMEKYWKGKKEINHFPKIDYMLLNEKGAREDIFLKVGTLSNSQVFFTEPENENVEIYWSIIPDMRNDKGIGQKEEMSNEITGLITENNKSKIEFKAPIKDGPYRLYVYISDPNEQVAISNIPFFVIE